MCYYCWNPFNFKWLDLVFCFFYDQQNTEKPDRNDLVWILIDWTLLPQCSLTSACWMTQHTKNNYRHCSMKDGSAATQQDAQSQCRQRTSSTGSSEGISLSNILWPRSTIHLPPTNYSMYRNIYRVSDKRYLYATHTEQSKNLYCNFMFYNNMFENIINNIK